VPPNANPCSGLDTNSCYYVITIAFNERSLYDMKIDAFLAYFVRTLAWSLQTWLARCVTSQLCRPSQRRRTLGHQSPHRSRGPRPRPVGDRPSRVSTCWISQCYLRVISASFPVIIVSSSHTTQSNIKGQKWKTETRYESVKTLIPAWVFGDILLLMAVLNAIPFNSLQMKFSVELQ